jgi:large subunit ribosomal protein L10
MPNPTKVDKVRELSERLTAAEAAVFAGYRGLTVQDASDLRSTLAEVETRFAVVKNTLAKLALKDAGLDGLEPFVDGPTAIAFVGGDPVTATKRLLDASKRYPILELKGGFAEGRVLSADQVRALASLESREVMLARLAGLAKYQMGRAAWMLQTLQAKFLALLEAYKEKLPPEEGESQEAPEISTETEPSGSEQESESEPTGETQEPESTEADAAGAETADSEGEGGS